MCTVVGLVLSLLMVFRCGDSLLFVWLVESCPAKFPAGPWLYLSFLRLGLSAELGSYPNLKREKVLTVNNENHYKTIEILGKTRNNKVIAKMKLFKSTECDIHLLSADRTVNGRLLLLLQFSSASFFPVSVLALLFSSSSSGLSETFGPPDPFKGSVGFLSSVEASVAGGAAWKNLCRAAWVRWAEVVHDFVG